MLQSMFDWLDCIRQRPAMYVHQWSLKELELLCHGYEAALHVNEIEEPGCNFNQSFADWLAEKQGWSLNCGWADAIRSHSESDEAAFHVFFDLLDLYRSSLTATPLPAGSRAE